MVTCAICGKEYKSVAGVHLTVHDITLDEYKKKYPNSKTKIDGLNEKISKSLSKTLLRDGTWNKGKTKETHASIAKTVKTRKQNNPNWFPDNYVHWTKSDKRTFEEKMKIFKEIARKGMATKIKNGTIASGKRNGMYGKSLYDVWLEKYGKDGADLRYKLWTERCSKRSKGKKNNMYGKPAPKGSGIGKKTEYKGIMFRSTWEAKVAKWFDDNDIMWRYEFHRYELEDGTTYLPDFMIWDNSIPKTRVIEVKGYMTEEAQRKIDLFNKSGNLEVEIWNSKKLKQMGIL